MPTFFPMASYCSLFRPISPTKSTFSALSFAKICLCQYFSVILHLQTRAGVSAMIQQGEGVDIFMAFTNACFWLLEPEKLQLVTQKQVIVDAHGCIITHLFRYGIRADIYTAWVSALLIWLHGFLRTSTADKWKEIHVFYVVRRRFDYLSFGSIPFVIVIA